jgi:hypothetical protein
MHTQSSQHHVGRDAREIVTFYIKRDVHKYKNRMECWRNGVVESWSAGAAYFAGVPSATKAKM